MSKCFPAINREKFNTLQFNIGRLCNQACLHCHVESSPKLTGDEFNANQELVDKVIQLLGSNSHITTIDLTGGAPELNPHFRRLVVEAKGLNKRVLVRHNLTVQFVEGQSQLPKFFAENQVELFCSLPCYLEENVNSQRGSGVFAESIRALRLLNEVGYGKSPELPLTLVYNPIGDTLPPPQSVLEEDYRRVLLSDYGVSFTNLVAITNQPIHRFKNYLKREQKYASYMNLLRDNFNSDTLQNIMCKSTVSIRWDGMLFDCDFNLVKSLPMSSYESPFYTIDDLLDGNPPASAVNVADHCFACTAGAGSSCGGVLVEVV
ncbi:MAG: arsenosugar biosynthesis radical SAM protein ArsS [Planctomycetota bacterium]|nr:arsenosugar biosynthesis radical SAM protein ArsS [Planctomycetota bacterium]